MNRLTHEEPAEEIVVDNQDGFGKYRLPLKGYIVKNEIYLTMVQ
jgi:hypothetical protein